MLATTSDALNRLGKNHCTHTLDDVTLLLNQLHQKMAELEAVSKLPEQLELRERCHYLNQTVIPVMNAVREIADQLECVCADELWPLPTYQEMLFIR